MATADSREVNAWYRDYCQDIFQAIGRNDLISQVNAPVNTDIQMASAADEIRIAELSIIDEFLPEMEPFWQTAVNNHRAAFAPVAEGGQVPDDLWVKYRALIQDDDLAKRYYKTLRRLTIRAEQKALYEASIA